MVGKPWPYHNDGELKAAGYKFDRRSRCSAIHNGGTCNAEIEWWWTPNQKRIPLDVGTMQPHHSTCPDVNLFRRKKA